MTDHQALKRIAKNLRQFREDAGLSMNALAKLIDDYPATIQRIEEGRHMPGIGLMTRLGEGLGKRLDDFVDEPKVFAEAS